MDVLPQPDTTIQEAQPEAPMPDSTSAEVESVAKAEAETDTPADSKLPLSTTTG